MIRHPPRSTRTDTLFPYTSLFRSVRRSQLSVSGAVVRGAGLDRADRQFHVPEHVDPVRPSSVRGVSRAAAAERRRSEEHTSDLQSLMRISYAVFCLKKRKRKRMKSQRHSRADSNDKNHIDEK